MERYIKPSIEIREIELNAIMAASGPEGASNELDSDPNNVIKDPTQLESKRTYSAWDDDEEE